MTIQDIKKEIGFTSLSMVRQFSKDGIKQEWLSHWDNDRRIRVSMHQNVFEVIKSNLQIGDLDYNIQEIEATAERKAYTRIVVVIRNKPRNNSLRTDDSYDYSYEKYNGAFGYDDDTIDNAFEGDPSNTWNID